MVYIPSIEPMEKTTRERLIDEQLQKFHQRWDISEELLDQLLQNDLEGWFSVVVIPTRYAYGNAFGTAWFSGSAVEILENLNTFDYYNSSASPKVSAVHRVSRHITFPHLNSSYYFTDEGKEVPDAFDNAVYPEQKKNRIWSDSLPLSGTTVHHTYIQEPRNYTHPILSRVNEKLPMDLKRLLCYTVAGRTGNRVWFTHKPKRGSLPRLWFLVHTERLEISCWEEGTHPDFALEGPANAVYDYASPNPWLSLFVREMEAKYGLRLWTRD